MTEVQMPSTLAPAIPVPASTLLLLRDGADGLEVLMVVRHAGAGVAGGAIVFPGGKVDRNDGLLRRFCASGVPDGGTEGDETRQIFRIAAIRETFEECAILLARGPGPIPSPVVGADPNDLSQALEAGGLMLADDLLVPFAHWITPADRARRFDTHFFIAPAPEGQSPRHDGGEVVETIWITPKAAIADADAERRRMMNPTYLNLSKLARYASVADALAGTRNSPIVTVLPERRETENGPIFLIPEEAGYGLSHMPGNEFRQPSARAKV